MLSEKSSGETGKATTRDRQREETRLRLLDAALDEFVAHGFAGASTRRVTTAAGVSHGLLFHHYPSKADLFVALVRLASAEVAVEPEAAIAAPLDFFAGASRRTLGMLRERPRTARVFVFMDYVAAHPGLVPEADALLREHDVVRHCIPVIEAGQASGEIRAGSPQALSTVFWAALQGVAQEVFLDPGVDLPDADWLLDLLRPRAAS